MIAAIAMAVIIAMAAYAINTAEWWDHSHHLQAQADAAALAAATQYVAGCSPGSSIEQNMANTVAQYDGAGTATAANGITGTASGGSYNQQLYPSPGSEVALINSDTFGTASYGSGLTGHPCTDGLLDVKLTEENLSSLIPSVNPGYINAESEVGFYEETQADDVEPFVFQDDVPKDMWVELVDENSIPTNCNSESDGYYPYSNKYIGESGVSCSNANVNPSTVIAWAPLSPPTGSGSDWTGTLVPGAPSATNVTPGAIDFTSTATGSTGGNFPVGMRIVASAYDTTNNLPPSCPEEFDLAAPPNGVVCFDIGNPNPDSPADTDDGVLFTRVYEKPSGETPGSPTATPAAPQLADAWLVPYTGTPGAATVDDCGATPGTDSSGTQDSNFFPGTTIVDTAGVTVPLSVQLCASMSFTGSGGTAVTCSTAGLNLYVNPVLPGLPTLTPTTSSPTTMNCPSGSTNGNGIWYSGAVPLTDSSNGTSANLVSGPTPFQLSWTLQAGNVPTEYEQTSTGAVAAGTVTLQQINGSQPANAESETGYQLSNGSPKACTPGNVSETCDCTSTGSKECYCSTTYPCVCGSATDYTCTGDNCGTSNFECIGGFDGAGDGSAAEVVQRAFDGTATQYQASYSRSGPVNSAELTNSSNDAVQSIPEGMTSGELGVSVSLIPGYSDDTPTAASVGNPVSLNAGDDDFSGEWDCWEPQYSSEPSSPSLEDGNSTNFNLEMQWWIEQGCNDDTITAGNGQTSLSASPPVASAPSSGDYYEYQLDSSTASPPACPTGAVNESAFGSSSPPSPPDCVEGVDDFDITWNLMAALNERIYGCSNAECSGDTVTCNNYWDTSNTIASIENRGAADKRLVTLPLTEFGAMYANSLYPVSVPLPIIGFAKFYITGWWGDPCISTTASKATGAVYDDSPADDTDIGENIAIQSNVDSGAYSESASGVSSTNGDSAGCSSSEPGYDSAVTTAEGVAVCTDQGIILGHFLDEIATSATGGVAATTTPGVLGKPCPTDVPDICVGILIK